jgi:single-strand DNA-binding protein
MSDINVVTLVGRLTKDAELRSTQGGTSVANFSIASGYTYISGGEKKELTSFFNCIAWGKTGEAISQYCKKGHRIGIVGRLQQRTWKDNNGNSRSTVEVVVQEFQFLQSRDVSNSGSAKHENDQDFSPGSFDGATPFDDEPAF